MLTNPLLSPHLNRLLLTLSTHHLITFLTNLPILVIVMLLAHLPFILKLMITYAGMKIGDKIILGVGNLLTQSYLNSMVQIFLTG
jgi:hypothetical protein